MVTPDVIVAAVVVASFGSNAASQADADVNCADAKPLAPFVPQFVLTL